MSKVAKAIVAALIGAYALYQVATGAESAGGDAVVLNEWVGIGFTGAIAGLGVWAVPNEQDQAPKHSQKEIS